MTILFPVWLIRMVFGDSPSKVLGNRKKGQVIYGGCWGPLTLVVKHYDWLETKGVFCHRGILPLAHRCFVLSRVACRVTVRLFHAQTLMHCISSVLPGASLSEWRPLRRFEFYFLCKSRTWMWHWWKGPLFICSCTLYFSKTAHPRTVFVLCTNVRVTHAVHVGPVMLLGSCLSFYFSFGNKVFCVLYGTQQITL